MISAGLLIQVLAMLLALLISKPGWREKCFAYISTVASLLLLFVYARILFRGLPFIYTGYIPGLAMNMEVIIDPLAAFFGLIFAFGFPWGLHYGSYYLKAHPNEGTASHLFWLGLMIISMHLVLILRNSLMFMVAWELMSISSFFAMLYERQNRETVANALYYFVMMHIGAAFLVAGFGLQYLQTGRLNFAYQDIGGVVKWLMLIGFAFKAGFFPFYSWLPKAHPVAPAHLSGMMSGLMIKTGVFGIIYVLSQSQWQAYEIYILLAISLITAFNGVIHALAETNIKRSLAYSSIENIGIIGIGLCFWLLGLNSNNPLMASLGFAGALMHTLNHSLFKPLLFYLSGNILVSTHSLEPDSLGGLGKRMPHTAILFLIGTGAISALPLMNGFISEFAIFLSILSGFRESNLGSTLASILAGSGFAFVSALALIAFSKVFSIVFGGEPRSPQANKAGEVSLGMLFSPFILAFVCLILGIFGRFALLFVLPLAQPFGLDLAVLTGFGNTLSGISIILLLLIFGFAVIYLLKRRLSSRFLYPTWACGYQKLSPKLQYTGSAFINPLAYFLKPLMHKTAVKQQVEGYFPLKMEYEEEVRDYVDKGIIQFLCRVLNRFYGFFAHIHNGKTNSYITYLLLALLALLFWVLGVSR